MADTFGDRMKSYEVTTRHFLPKRCYTIIRLDGRAFHTWTRKNKCIRPFDIELRDTMQHTAKMLCAQVGNCRIGYEQSDEITLLLTDFDTFDTQAWFGGNIQKIVSVSASIATAAFNSNWFSYPEHKAFNSLATFDSRVYTIADPFEAYNAFLWRQQDATRNSLQMIAQSLYSHKELHGKKQSDLQEMIWQKGHNFNDFPTMFRRGSFIIPAERGWTVDTESPILSQDKNYFFSRVPALPQYVPPTTNSSEE
jgi:tRNA(His) 5'-end guanylyltransferase